jgi:hypothetical protein
VARKWNPAYHPRGKGGRFTRSSTRVMTQADRNRGRKAMEGLKPTGFGDAGAGRDYLEKIGPDAPSGAAAKYLDEDWRDVNAALRAGKHADGVDEIDQAMRPLPDDLMLRRQVPLSLFAHVPMKDLEGMKVRDAAYASTSLDVPGHEPGGGDVVTMHIAAPKGTPALVNADDGEILLARDTEVAITRVEPDGRGGWDVYGTVLPKAKKRGAQSKANPPAVDGKPNGDDTASPPAANDTSATEPVPPAPSPPSARPAPEPPAPAPSPADVPPQTSVDQPTVSFDDRLAAAATERKALDAAPLSLLPRSRGNPDLTPEGAKVLKEYRQGESGDVGRALRDGGDISALTAARIGAFDGAMAASPLTSDAVLYRAAPLARDVFGDRAAGDLTGLEWRENGFVSTTANRKTAEGGAVGGGLLMRILAPAGTGAIALSAGSSAEVLLDRKHTYRVVKDHGRRKGEPRIVDVEIVPKTGDEPDNFRVVETRETTPDNPLSAEAVAKLPDTPLGRGLASGIAGSSTLSGGAVGDTRLATFTDGSKAVQKIAQRSFAGSTQKDLTDSEDLAGRIGAAIGAPVPGVVRTNDAEVFMEYVPGSKPGALFLNRYDLDERDGKLGEFLDSRDGRLLGVLDLIVANNDRHDENWLVRPDGSIVGIDHGLSWGTGASSGQDAQSGSPRFDSKFAARLNSGRVGDGGWVPNDLTKADVTWMREQVAALRADFDAQGRGDWLDYSLARLDQIHEWARGTKDLVRP